MSDLPAAVYNMVELSPIEDILLAILRAGLPGVAIQTLISENAPTPFVLVRRMPGMGGWNADARFTDEGRFFVHTFTDNPDGDQKGAILSEAVRIVLRQAWLSHVAIPGRGSIISIKMVSEPSRKSDWATSSGPVQYADLPNGLWRYESQYEIKVRKQPR